MYVIKVDRSNRTYSIKRVSRTIKVNRVGRRGLPGVVQSIVPGDNVTVDSSDPANPIVSSTGGGGGGNMQIGEPVVDAEARRGLFTDDNGDLTDDILESKTIAFFGGLLVGQALKPATFTNPKAMLFGGFDASLIGGNETYGFLQEISRSGQIGYIKYDADNLDTIPPDVMFLVGYDKDTEQAAMIFYPEGQLTNPVPLIAGDSTGIQIAGSQKFNEIVTELISATDFQLPTAKAVADAIAAITTGIDWGQIGGDIIDQDDLMDELNSKMQLIGTYSFGSDNINFYDGRPSIDIDAYVAKNGEMIRVRTGGSHNFGSGIIYGEENDLLYFDNTQWKLIKNFTMTVAALTANSLLATGGSTNQLISLNPASYPSLTEVSYVKGTTSPIQTQLNGKIATTQKGAINGVAELDSSGLVPASQLPSYVDDVVEYANFASLPVTGEASKIYVTLDDNKTFRWGGSSYVEISPSIALGETSSTAYRGDRGKIAYDHSQDVTTNPHNVTKTQVGLSAVTNDAQLKIASNLGDVANAAAARSNLGLGTVAVLASDTDYTMAADSDFRVATQKATKAHTFARTTCIKPVSGDWYSMGGQSSAATPGITNAGKIIFHPIWLDAGTIAEIAVSSTVAAVSTWRLGLYKSDPATGLPDGMTPFWDAGTVNMNNTAGIQTIVATKAITEPGLYWAAVLCDAYTAQPTTHNVTYSSNSGVGILGLPQDMSSLGRYRVGRTYGSTVPTGSLPTVPTSSMSWVGVAPRVAVKYA